VNKTEYQRRRDIAFLEELRTATLERLRELAANHSNKSAPLWKKIAIERAIARKGLLVSGPSG
jgi:hypothetical protein